MFQFDPISAGFTTVTVASPDAATLTNGVRGITITGPSISMNNLGTVGAGLEGPQRSAVLSLTNHGGNQLELKVPTHPLFK